MNDVLLTPIRLNELEVLIENSVQRAFKINATTNEPSLKWLDLNGLSNYLPSKPAHATIYGWLSSGSIPAHKQGNRWIFSVQEIDDWIKSKKQKTSSEIEAEVDVYLSNKNKAL
jgi:excisionase family DNA binding protein